MFDETAEAGPQRDPDEIEIARLAILDDLDYARARKEAALRLGVPLKLLDRLVEAARRAAGTGGDFGGARNPDAAILEDEIARGFAETYAGRMVFDHTSQRWSTWTGKRWLLDETDSAFFAVRNFCRQRMHEAAGQQRTLPIAMGKITFAASVEKAARSDPKLAVTSAVWDTNPWLLGVPGGVVDLRTGETLAPDPALYISKQTAVAPGGECPLWRAFIERITGGDGELAKFIQRVAGLALTGITRDHALFFAFGTGANGKGVTLNTLTNLMGEYAAVATMETFTASPTDRHPTDLAMLRGARLVTAQETEEGRRWAESRIKALTGGDPVTARFMRQDFFTYQPQFKLLIAGNHRPVLRGVDEAIRRLFHLIAFAITIPPAERDESLPEKLKSEWAGILAWAIEGCLEWQRIGLSPPPAVTGATDEYLAAEDSLGAWLDERTRRVGWGGAETSALFADWTAWAKAAGEEPGSLKRFVQALAGRGLQATKNGTTRRSEIPGLALADVARSWHETEDQNS